MSDTPREQGPHARRKLVIYTLVAFVAGLFVSPYLTSQIYGYRNAEECILAEGGSRAAAYACFELYPRVSEQRKNKP